jgi:hypothetical protein
MFAAGWVTWPCINSQMNVGIPCTAPRRLVASEPCISTFSREAQFLSSLARQKDLIFGRVHEIALPIWEDQTMERT